MRGVNRFALALILPLAALCGCESPAEPRARSARAPAQAGQPPAASSPSEPPPSPTQERAPLERAGARMNETSSPARRGVQTATFGLG